MEHRDKRPRLDETEDVDYSPAGSTPVPAASVLPKSDADITTTTAHDAASETNRDTSMQASPDATGTPDKATWQGWAEIENDPIVFNVMLREWGVRGIQVNEVVPLDAVFDSSPSSTFGLIFLSRYSTNNKEEQDIAIPQGLWFANQTSTFSCATVALMNILSNIENVNLGPEMSQFFMATSDMSSKDKGLALHAFEHVRKVHNSFATLIDMKSVDRRLKADAKVFAQKQKQAAKKPAVVTTTSSSKAKPSKKGKKAKTKRCVLSEESDAAVDEADESGFHFTAYVPAHNLLWRMDGLQRQPESLGTLPSDDSNWLAMAVAELSAQWQSAAENNLEFSLLSLVAAREDEAGRMEENVQADRLREDWGPALAELVRVVADSG
ncbi:hypothetical protein EPUS_07427 [Endocarpon pusillum Z07020]|uniref:ubiquitinyl hydrolase 1 n=1 Tax=Endocarpon pusillum (strain Z07020 / HMAS-L-300199) TaxID=1263415 RepID=U1HQM7_ENDPU|nr:uncharacterized protein EPUS_07427 [Endocarpon pusillum Z07020]ERF71399.1 hypothetical protein EPUS_07427 [Endocarpon pusillum Z07020]